MTPVIIDYPVEITFNTRKTFIDEHDRTVYLRKLLRKMKVPSPFHEYDDYVVEDYRTVNFSDGPVEIWIVGS